MTRSLTAFAAVAAIAVAVIALPRSADAEVILVAGTMEVVAGPQPSSSVVCEVRREQFADVYGWRVRDVVVCHSR